MKKNFKRVCACLGILAIATTGFAGCGKKGELSDGDAVPEIFVYVNNGVATGSGAEAGSNSKALEEIQNYVIDKIGIKVTPIIPPSGNETEKLNTLLASKEKLDLFWGNWDTYSSNGAIIPIDELLEKYGSDIQKKWPEDSWKAMTDSSGRVWGVPRFTATRSYPVYVRKDWLEKYNLPKPKTLDDLEVIFKAFKDNDPSGNHTTIPVLSSLDGMQMGISAGFTGIGYDKFLDSDGKVKPVELMDEYKDFVSLMNKWYVSGYLYKECFAIKQKQKREFIKQNKVGVYIDWYSDITGMEETLKLNNPEAFYEVYNINGPKGDIQTVRKATTRGALIPASSKNAEAVMKYMNLLYGDLETYLTVSRGIKDRDWHYVDETKPVIQIDTEQPAYFGELNIAMSTPIENYIYNADGKDEKSLNYLRTTCIDEKIGVKPLDMDFNFDKAKIEEKVPLREDIDRLLDEEITKFITGARPISEYDEFRKELEAAGVNNLIDAYTEQYKQRVKK